MKIKEFFDSNSTIDRKLLSLYILWVLLNFSIMFIFGHPTGKLSVYVYNDPYEESSGGGSMEITYADQTFFYPFGENGIKYYDYTEFLFYSLLPLGLYCAKQIAYPKKNENTSNLKANYESQD